MTSIATPPPPSGSSNGSTNESIPVASKKAAYVWAAIFVALIIYQLKVSTKSPLFWVHWEAGTLISAILYTVIFYFRLFWRDLHKGLTSLRNGVVLIFLFGALAFMGSATAWTVFTAYHVGDRFTALLLPMCGGKPQVVPVFFLLLAMASFCGVDLVFFSHNDPDVRKEFARGFYFNGLPVFAAFVILFLFVCLFQDAGLQMRDLELKSFIAGAVAFEVLTGNTAFVILFSNRALYDASSGVSSLSRPGSSDH